MEEFILNELTSEQESFLVPFKNIIKKLCDKNALCYDKIENEKDIGQIQLYFSIECRRKLISYKSHINYTIGDFNNEVRKHSSNLSNLSYVDMNQWTKNLPYELYTNSYFIREIINDDSILNNIIESKIVKNSKKEIRKWLGYLMTDFVYDTFLYYHTLTFVNKSSKGCNEKIGCYIDKPNFLASKRMTNNPIEAKKDWPIDSNFLIDNKDNYLILYDNHTTCSSEKCFSRNDRSLIFIIGYVYFTWSNDLMVIQEFEIFREYRNKGYSEIFMNLLKEKYLIL
jgi:hypothetical protein